MCGERGMFGTSLGDTEIFDQKKRDANDIPSLWESLVESLKSNIQSTAGFACESLLGRGFILVIFIAPGS